MAKFEVLKGLPPYGDEPVWFSQRGREGLVVQFMHPGQPVWVANFASGMTQFVHVCEHPNERDVIVVANGELFIVNPSTRALEETFGGQIDCVFAVPELSLLVYGNGLWFVAVGSMGRTWTTRRLSWDGMRSVHCEGLRLVGEAWSPFADGNWVPFAVSLATGMCIGGSYDGLEDMTTILNNCESSP